MDRRTRKILAMNGYLHTRSNVARLYLPRKEGGRGLIGIEECVRRESKSLQGYVAGHFDPYRLIHFQTRSVCFNLGQLVSTQVSLGQVQNTGHRSLFYQYRNTPNHLQLLTFGLKAFVYA